MSKEDEDKNKKKKDKKIKKSELLRFSFPF